MAAKNILPFLHFVQGECTAAGISLELLGSSITNKNALGYFDPDARKLTVCAGDVAWAGALAHEAAHLAQWIAQSPVWVDAYADDTLFESWLAGKVEIPTRKLLRVTRAIQRCEHDAEKRAMRWIKEYGLTDPAKYARAANVHLWKYDIAMRHRKWFRDPYGRGVEDDSAVSGLIPDKLLPFSKITKLDPMLEHLIVEHCRS